MRTDFILDYISMRQTLSGFATHVEAQIWQGNEKRLLRGYAPQEQLAEAQ